MSCTRWLHNVELHICCTLATAQMGRAEDHPLSSSEVKHSCSVLPLLCVWSCVAAQRWELPHDVGSDKFVGTKMLDPTKFV